MDGDASGGGEWSGRGGVEAAPALFTGNWEWEVTGRSP